MLTRKEELKAKILESRKYKLGIKVGAITAFCEAAGTEAKDMSLSSLFLPEDYDFLFSEAEKVAKRNRVHLYLEKDLLATDLFPDVDATGRWVFVIYKKKEILDKYLALKAEKERLVQAGKYIGDARKEIAREMGRLLGYSEGIIEEKIKRGSQKAD